jgi:hypothetical protein
MAIGMRISVEEGTEFGGSKVGLISNQSLKNTTMIGGKYWAHGHFAPKQVKFRGDFLHHGKLKFLDSTTVFSQIFSSLTYLKLNIIHIQFLV